MSERGHYPSGVPCWVDTPQPDVDSALHFYAELFGWEYTGPGEMPGEPPGRYFVAQLRGRDVAGVSSGPSGPMWNTYIAVESVDEAAERAARAGGTVITTPFDAPPAGRMAAVADPAGASFCLWESGARRGAELVNEPGAWAMSMLHTPDPGEAEAFYAQMFGWRSEQFGFGDAGVVLWRLRGYVGGEPEQPVPRDVVAVMMSVGGDGPGATLPPHWSIDLWTRDADAVAAKAVELGGKVLAGPDDVPGFRTAVLADPQGATFSVSQLIVGVSASGSASGPRTNCLWPGGAPCSTICPEFELEEAT